jgi:oligosaccharide repeat unit polymerase
VILPVTAAILASWSLTMYRYGRSALFPPALLALVWAFTLLGLWACGTMYFPITGKTQAIVLLGVAAFSLGGVFAARLPISHTTSMTLVTARRRSQVRRFLRFTPLLLVANIPFFILYLRQLGGTISPRASMWKQVRMASIKANATGGGGFHIESSLLPFISLAALIAVWECADTNLNRVRTVVILALACAYHLANGARSDLLLLLLSAVTIVWLRRGAPPTRALIIAALSFSLLFAVNQIAMGKFGADPGATTTDNIPRVAQGFATYWLGGIVAFDQISQNPRLRYGWDLNKFATRVANKFGAGIQDHTRHLDYTKVSPSQLTNVYSVFLPYYMQWDSSTGVMLLMGLMGAVSTFVFRKAIHGSCWAVFAYGAFVFCTLMTIFSDEYFAQITFVFKIAVTSLLVYFLPRFSVESQVHWVPAGNPEPELCE